MTYSTIEQATMALAEVEQDVRMDAGDEAVETAWRDLVHVVADQCTDEVAAELLRRNGV